MKKLLLILALGIAAATTLAILGSADKAESAEVVSQ